VLPCFPSVPSSVVNVLLLLVSSVTDRQQTTQLFLRRSSLFCPLCVGWRVGVSLVSPQKGGQEQDEGGHTGSLLLPHLLSGDFLVAG